MTGISSKSKKLNEDMGKNPMYLHHKHENLLLLFEKSFS